MGGRIAVLGAGLIGCYVGGRLAAGGAAVTLIGRARVLEPLRRDGLVLSGLDGWRARVAPDALAFATGPEALAGAGLILVTVKSAATGSAADDIRAHSDPDALIVSLQNGVDNAARLRAALPGRAVLAGMVPFNVAEPEPGRFHQGTSGALAVEAGATIAPWRGAFAAAGLSLDEHADMAAVMWGKLLLNLNNAVNALSGMTLAEELATRGYRRALALAMAEALAVLRRAGIAPARIGPAPPGLMPWLLRLPDPLYRRVARRSAPAIDREARSSMAEDLAAGRATEVDHINGAVTDLAARIGSSAPVNRALVRLVRAAERGAPPLAPGALLAELRR